MLLQPELTSLLRYCPDTGVFRWACNRSHNALRGDIAGYQHLKGYWAISIRGKQYLAHRLAWFYFYKRWPVKQIDHINGVKDDNRISNLRLATNAQNAQNLKKPHCDNKSGFLGVYRNGKGWSAQLTCSGNKIHLGTFGTPEEANAVYLREKEQMHPFFVASE